MQISTSGKEASLSNYTFTWDIYGIPMLQKAESKKIRGVIQKFGHEFIQQLAKISDGELVELLDVERKDGNKVNCFALVVDESYKG